VIILSSLGAFAQKTSVADASQPDTRILFLFDASQSMYGRWESDIKYDVARKLVEHITDSLDRLNHVQMALRVYGHTKTFPPQDCDDTELEVSFGYRNGTSIKERLRAIKPSGTTPIAQSLLECGEDFPDNDGRNIIILITDGIEECEGDPCAVSRMLQQKGIFLKPFIIGLNMSANLQKEFDCVGSFYDASTESAFAEILGVVISQALNNTTLQVNLLDIYGDPTETNVNMTFYNMLSGQIEHNFIHTMNSKGRPDTLVVDPLVTYRIVAHTLPPVSIDSVSSVPGKHTTVGIDAPQGDLYLEFKGFGNYRDLKCIVRRSGEMNTLHVQDFNTTQRYLVGKYDLEVLSLPRMYIDNVDISQSKTTTVQVPDPGIATIVTGGYGYGSLYVEKQNELRWIYDMDHTATKENITLLPGKYRVVYRAKNARESEYTIEQTFRITSGSSQVIKLTR
jgi:Ca-activated chloride channel family protein